MTSIETVTLEVPDTKAAEKFYADAFGQLAQVRVTASDAVTSGFRGFTVSLVVSQPSTVSSLVDSAVAAGATVLKPVEKSLWGVGGAVRAPDGAIWTIATSAKKDTGPATRTVDSVVVLLAGDDVAASKKFYVDRGFTVGKSFGKYVEFDMPDSPVKLSLYTRKALAKNAGTTPEGTGSHRIVLNSAAGPFTDPDGFTWQSV